MSFVDEQAEAERHGMGMTEPPIRRILRDLPRPRDPDGTAAHPPHPEPPDEEMIAKMAIAAATKRSEARRDAVVVVAAAIQRRGQDAALGWTIKDIETVYAIAEHLIALGD